MTLCDPGHSASVWNFPRLDSCFPVLCEKLKIDSTASRCIHMCQGWGCWWVKYRQLTVQRVGEERRRIATAYAVTVLYVMDLIRYDHAPLCTVAHTHTHTRSPTRLCAHAHTHTHTHAHLHAYVHTHTQALDDGVHCCLCCFSIGRRRQVDETAVKVPLSYG